VKKHSETVKT